MNISTDEKRVLFFHPKLPKKVDMEHERGCYCLYSNEGIILKRIGRYDDDYIGSTKDLLKKVKDTLDSINREKLALKRKKDHLYTWDGYTSEQIKRDEKIKQII